MLSLEDAKIIISRDFPDGNIQKIISYQDLYIFQIFTDDPDEGDQDPFFSINKNTGEFRDFSIITDGDTTELIRLFEED